MASAPNNGEGRAVVLFNVEHFGGVTAVPGRQVSAAFKCEGAALRTACVDDVTEPQDKIRPVEPWSSGVVANPDAAAGVDERQLQSKLVRPGTGSFEEVG